MSERPNVIVVFTDQQRWDTVGIHGNPMDLTPNFDRLARAGTFARNSFTCQPVCGPARSVLQTGRYPITTGCYRNGIPLPRTEQTLAHYFKAGGYDTAYIGKWHLATQDPVPSDERGGYQRWLASNLLEFTSEAYDTVLYDEENRAVRLPGYRVDALMDAAIRYFDQDHEKPFFLFLSFLEPHHQNNSDSYPAPLGYEERIAKRLSLPRDLQSLGGSAPEHYAGYMGMVARLDEAFGRLVDAVYSLKQWDNTIILFSSDHGCHFKTRNREYKRSCHEASIRVPTLFHGPGFAGRGNIEDLVSIIDLPPTLLDAAGLPIPEEMQGRSILRSKDATSGETDDVFIQVSEDHVGRALRTRRWKYELAAPEADGWNDMNSSDYVETELYDLEADPFELDNLIGSQALGSVRRELRERLVRRMIAAGEPEPRIHAG